MYNELDKKAYKLYQNFMKSEFCLNWYGIDYFIRQKNFYKYYFDEATIILRKEKLKKLSKYDTQRFRFRSI